MQVLITKRTYFISFGTAMAAVYYLSEGNLIIPSIIHGTYDAIAYVGVATSLETSSLLRNIMLLIGIFFAGVIIARRILADFRQ